MPCTEADLRRALENEEFYPVFQPMVEIRTGQLAGFEVLARWNCQGQEISPEVFVPAIEYAGLISPMTQVLTRKVFACAALQQSRALLSLNISARQLLDPDMPRRVERLASEFQFPLHRLTLELTESALLDNLDRAAAVAHDLKSLGCRLALDDFGTGYSSLRHVHALPLDEIKVDRSFVESMAVRRESRAIVASVVGLGQGLKLLTVAEGVETQEQAEMLFWMGCDLGQGWFYGHPVPADELPDLLDRRIWPLAVSVQPIEGASHISLEAIAPHRMAQLQAIYDGAPVGLCFLNQEMRYVSLNRRLAEMNGAPVAAHIGRTVEDVIPEVFAQVEPYIRRALAGEPMSGVEFKKPGVGKDGADQILVGSYRPVRESNGDVVGVSAAITDMTLYKRTEQALLESETHFRHMLQLGPHVPWVVNAQGGVVEASSRWEEITGQPVPAALGDGWMRMLHPDDIAPTRAAIDASLKSGHPIDIEYRVRDLKGAWRRMRSRGSPRFGDEGHVQGIYGVVEDIEEHRKMSEELQRCHAELRAALNSAPMGMILADGSDGAITLVNRRAQQIFGTGAFPGQKFTQYLRMQVRDVDGQLLKLEKYPLAKVIQHGQPTEPRTYLLRQPDGIMAQIVISARPIYSDAGELIGGMMVVREPGLPDDKEAEEMSTLYEG
ncbi:MULTISPECIES: EAL domain-containing protein [Acidobacterium]|nr:MULTISPECIES: EAL domain-containing protein [Acidobacterium]HCT59252.1 PAS domain S-box protein [Acidobacterium sp.]